MNQGHLKIFLFSLVMTAVIAYALIEYWIIPEYVPENKRSMAAAYTGYGLTIVTSVYFILTTVIDSFMSSSLSDTAVLTEKLGGRRVRWL